MTVLAGDDALTVPIMAVGGKGVVSVLGNVVPDRMRAMVHAALEGRWSDAQRVHLELYELAQAMFVESNPAPVKYIMNALGLRVGGVRPPLAPLRKGSREHVDRILTAAGLAASPQ